jgi:hypothetical protein
MNHYSVMEIELPKAAGTEKKRKKSARVKTL